MEATIAILHDAAERLGERVRCRVEHDARAAGYGVRRC